MTALNKHTELRKELSNPAIGSNHHLRKLALSLLDELDVKEEQRANWFQMAQKLGEDLDAAERNIAETNRLNAELTARIELMDRRTATPGGCTMSNIDKQALLGADKHANQHRLSRLIIEANSAELRAIAEAVEQYTDQLIAALEAEEKRIAELEARAVQLPQRLSPEGYHIDEAYMVDGAEGEYLDRDAVIEAISAAGIQVKGE